MVDSDGFQVEEMTEEDYGNLTLEEKILCGYFKLSSSPRNGGEQSGSAQSDDVKE